MIIELNFIQSWVSDARRTEDILFVHMLREESLFVPYENHNLTRASITF